MKLVLAYNQSDRFIDFYRELQKTSTVPFDYAGYQTLIFYFSAAHLRVKSLQTGRWLSDYDGVYINGYLPAYELAASVAIACDTLGIGYDNSELANPPSLSKISMYAKLASKGVPIPPTIAGTKRALLAELTQNKGAKYPAVLKRADVDRGIDNFKVTSMNEIHTLLDGHSDDSLWLLQDFIPNDGYYMLCYYDTTLQFCVYRTLAGRTAKNPLKAHMYKPKGGSNAKLITLKNVPQAVATASKQAMQAMNRQIASVDCIYDADTDRAWVLEVNYNPQLVTIETFKDVRVDAFLRNVAHIGDTSKK